jgi:hypothetical protein
MSLHFFNSGQAPLPFFLLDKHWYQNSSSRKLQEATPCYPSHSRHLQAWDSCMERPSSWLFCTIAESHLIPRAKNTPNPGQHLALVARPTQVPVSGPYTTVTAWAHPCSCLLHHHNILRLPLPPCQALSFPKGQLTNQRSSFPCQALNITSFKGCSKESTHSKHANIMRYECRPFVQKTDMDKQNQGLLQKQSSLQFMKDQHRY